MDWTSVLVGLSIWLGLGLLITGMWTRWKQYQRAMDERDDAHRN